MTVTRWTWAATSCRGVSHQRADIRLQDAFKCVVGKGTSEPIVIVVSDGAGTATFGGEGASLICRTIARCARRHFEANVCMPNSDALEAWVDTARDHIAAIAGRRQLSPRDFAATLVAVISDGTESVTVHIGDGCAVLKDVERNAWIASTWPDHGEYASTTHFLTDEPIAHVRVTSYTGLISGIAVFSDGLERLVLDLRANEPYGPFFERMISPVVNSVARGKDRDLSLKLRAYLDGEQINNRTDDDKTLVLAVRR